MPELKEVFKMVSQKVEPDLDSWKQQERRQRRSSRSRKLGAFALVAALGVAVAVAVVLSRPDDARRTDVGDPPPDTVQGAAPTIDTLAGIWLNDNMRAGGANDGLLMELNPDGTFAIDGYGLLDSGPATQGTYEIRGGEIAFSVGRSARCPLGEAFSLRAGIPEDGRLHTVMTEPGCTVTAGTEWTWTRVSPSSAAGAEITAGDPSGDAAPPEDVISLRGIWLLEGSGHLLRISWSGSYTVDDMGRLGTDPIDEGRVELKGRTLIFTSGGGSRGCGQGARWVWGNVSAETFGTVIRGTAREDECGHGAEGAELTWIRISSEQI
jgi:hypothetical protein